MRAKNRKVFCEIGWSGTPFHGMIPLRSDLKPNNGGDEMRKEIAYISPLRLGIIDAAIVAVMYLVFGILGLIFGGMMGGMAGGMEGGGMMVGGGFVALIGGILVGAIAGFIGGAVGAIIYNVAAGIVGGVVIELRDA